MFHIEGSMKWTVLVILVQAIFCNRLKTAAQDMNSSLSLNLMMTTVDEINMTITSFLDSSILMTTMVEMTLTTEITSPIDMTPTFVSSFTVTMTTMPVLTTSMTPSTSLVEQPTTTTTTSSVVTTTTSNIMPNPTPKTESDDEGLSIGVIIGIAAGGAAAVFVIVIILCCCLCCCYQKRHREESYNIGPTVTARYWDANHPNDAGPGHITSGGSMRSRTSWRESLRSFTRGSLRRSLSMRRSSKRAKDKQQPSEYIGLYSTPL